MIKVTDRVPTYAGRFKMTDAETSTEKYVTLERADVPTTEGTKINKSLFDSLQKQSRSYRVKITSDKWSSVNNDNKAPYTTSNRITVDGMNNKWIPGNPVCVATMNATIDLAMQEALTCISVISSKDGYLEFFCYENKPDYSNIPATGLDLLVPGVISTTEYEVGGI